MASTALPAATAPTATATPRVSYSFNKDGSHAHSPLADTNGVPDGQMRPLCRCHR